MYVLDTVCYIVMGSDYVCSFGLQEISTPLFPSSENIVENKNL